MIANPSGTTWQDAAIALLAKIPTDATPHLDALAARDIDSLHYLQYDVHAPAQRLYDKVWAARRAALESAIARCVDHGVVPLVWKGAEFLARYCAPHAIGALGDLDLLVARSQLGEARHALVQAGFRTTELAADGSWRPRSPFDDPARLMEAIALPHLRTTVAIDLDAAERAATRFLPHGTLTDDHTRLIVSIDLHHNAIASGFPIELISERAESSRLVNARAFVAEDHLWLCALRYYMEVAHSGKRSLRHLAYLIALLESETGTLDWDEVVRCACRFRAAPPLYYTLGLIARLRDKLVPGEVLEGLDPARADRTCDVGWQVGLLFDFIEPCPRWGWS